MLDDSASPAPGVDPFKVPLDRLPGVTPRRLTLLQRLGLQTVGDLLFHLPRAYEDLTDVRPIRSLSAGTIQTVQGEVVEMDTRSLADGRFIVSVVLSDDGTHVIEGAWFNHGGPAKRFRYGQWLSFSGKPKWFRDHWQMSTPRVRVLEGPTDDQEETTAPGIVPVYPLTEDLRLEHLRPLLARALDAHAAHIREVLPEKIRQRHNWPEVSKALRTLHFPPTIEAAGHARRRLVYEELLVLQLALALRRRGVRDQGRAPVLRSTPAIDAHIRRLFPFALTPDQDQAVAEVVQDLASERPMQRMVQADVGAGKTAVAIYALLLAVANKHQAALMVPTEVLARQHADTLDRYLAHSRVRRLLLTGSLSPRERRGALEDLAEGRVDLVIGTTALVQEDVRFARLGLVVIDEQHKFGVHQRARMRHLGTDPHYLVMTATPIPRTVALTVFGDLDVSTIKGQPPGRKPVRTRHVEEKRRDEIFELIRKGLTAGRQAYLVCPVIDESETLAVRSAVATHTEMQAGPFRDFRLGLLHGRLEESEKADIMERFRTRQLDMLVCTSVVEVGVDVPNATMMVVEHAERFGLSQLHQLRGRVARGKEAGQCWLFAAPGNAEAEERLRMFVRTSDGFALAEADVKLRGVGEFFGARQHGLGELRVANLVLDADVLKLARRDAFSLVADDATLQEPEHAPLRAEVQRRYGETLDLATVG